MAANRSMLAAKSNMSAAPSGVSAAPCGMSAALHCVTATQLTHGNSRWLKGPLGGRALVWDLNSGLYLDSSHVSICYKLLDKNVCSNLQFMLASRLHNTSAHNSNISKLTMHALKIIFQQRKKVIIGTH